MTASQALRERWICCAAQMPHRNASESQNSGRKAVSFSKGLEPGWSGGLLHGWLPLGSIVQAEGGKGKGGGFLIFD